MTAGTATATFVIPNGNAASVYILYGTDPKNLTHSTNQQTVSGDSTTIVLPNLDAKTTYTFQIVRGVGDQLVHSANASFTTAGYNLSLQFLNKDDVPVQGIKAQLLKPSKKLTSDITGTVTVTGLSAGAYNVQFTYKGQLYSQDFSTASSADAGTSPKTIIVTKTIDLDSLRTAAATAKPVNQKSGGKTVLVALLSELGLILFVFIIVAALRRRKRYSRKYKKSIVTDVGLPPSLQNYVYGQPTTQASHPAHMGESLRDMVVLSMAEEAAKNGKHNKPDEDNVWPI